ncbi:MAG TPA: DegT/DnrJ/EryC1/StrS family aminotransferase [bacterium]|nr:DegT/DnrJ/EryC1/StrS family aminotransferase [bacterium]
MIRFLDLRRQYLQLKKEIDEAVLRVIAEGSFVKGSDVREFEKEFADYLKADHCIACANGTDALTALIKCLELPFGSTVVVPANTFVATAESVISNGLKVKFADIDEDYTISPESVESVMTEDVSAVIAVHLYGQPAKIPELKKITAKWNVPLIEDAAQSHGAMIGNVKAGSLGDGAAFSFYPGKVLGAMGDAGAVVVNDDILAKKVRQYCDHGRTEKYRHEVAGINSRMDTIQAAVLNVKLKYLENWIGMRNNIAEAYLNLLKDVEGLKLPLKREGLRHAWHLFVVRHVRRDELKEYLRENGVETGIHYPLSLPEQPVFKDHMSYAFKYKAVKYSSELLSLPMGEHLSVENIEKIAELLKKFHKKNNF